MGFMMGINLTLQVAFGVPTELAAIATLFTFWDPNKNHAAAYIAGFLVLTVLVNIVGVRWYGEIEFFFGKSSNLGEVSAEADVGTNTTSICATICLGSETAFEPACQ